MQILCRVGLHKWGIDRNSPQTLPGDLALVCGRCGRTKVMPWRGRDMDRPGSGITPLTGTTRNTWPRNRSTYPGGGLSADPGGGLYTGPGGGASTGPGGGLSTGPGGGLYTGYGGGLSTAYGGGLSTQLRRRAVDQLRRLALDQLRRWAVSRSQWRALHRSRWQLRGEPATDGCTDSTSASAR